MTATKGSGGRNFKERAIEEMKKYAMLTAYLWLLFFLLSMYRRLLLKEYGIDPWTQSYAIVNALVFAKVLLLGDILDIGAGLRKRAFVWVVVGRTALFTALLIAFHSVEEAVRALIKGEAVADSVLHLGGGSWFGVWVYTGLMFMLLLPVVAWRELSFVLGKDTLWGIVTRREAKP